MGMTDSPACGARRAYRRGPALADSPGFLRVSGSFGILDLAGRGPAGADPGAGVSWQRNVNHCSLTFCSLGPWDRGNLCRRAAAAGGAGGGRVGVPGCGVGVAAGRVVAPGSYARLSATSLAMTMEPCPRGPRWCQGASPALRPLPASGLPPASQAECDTPTDFRDTRRISAPPRRIFAPSCVMMRHPCVAPRAPAAASVVSATRADNQPRRTDLQSPTRWTFGPRSVRIVCAGRAPARGQAGRGRTHPALRWSLAHHRNIFNRMADGPARTCASG
jgi:hypothetical protein